MTGKWRLHRPETLEEALSLLSNHGDEARVYAGGTELVLLLKFGLASPSHLVDIKRCGLDRLTPEEGGTAIGACVTHERIERSPVVKEVSPALASAEKMVANVRVRAVGTLGGNLCFAEPSSDIATILVASGARLEIRSEAGYRQVEAGDFFVHSFTTVVEPHELLTVVHLPSTPPNTATSYQRVAMGERPSACVGCSIEVGRDNVVAGARVVVGAAHPTPVRVQACEALLVGVSAEEAHSSDLLATLGDLCATSCEPVSDVHASAEYKRKLINVLTQRALAQAVIGALTHD